MNLCGEAKLLKGNNSVEYGMANELDPFMTND